MPIEFPCTQCGKLLRTADETAGRLAKCPACGSVMSVPDRAEASRAAGGLTPFGDSTSPDDSGDSMNPYQAPPEHGIGSPFAGATPAIEQVRSPAICLIVMATMGLIINVGMVLLYVFVLFMQMAEHGRGRPEDAILGFGIIIGSGILGAALAALALAGGVKMKNLQSYGLAMTAAILMVIPCFSPCGLLGIPFGIWALVVLAKPEVRAAFR